MIYRGKSIITSQSTTRLVNDDHVQKMMIWYELPDQITPAVVGMSIAVGSDDMGIGFKTGSTISVPRSVMPCVTWRCCEQLYGSPQDRSECISLMQRAETLIDDMS